MRSKCQALRSHRASTQVWYGPYTRYRSATSVPNPEGRHTCCPTFWSRPAGLPDGLGASRRPRDKDRSARKRKLALRRKRLFPKDENQMIEKSTMAKSQGRIIGRARQAQTNYHGTKHVTHGSQCEFHGIYLSVGREHLCLGDR